MTIQLGSARARRGRRFRDQAFKVVCIGATLASIVVLATLLGSIVRDGTSHLDWEFLTSYPSRRPANCGIKSALWGSVWLVCVAAVFAIPLGVATAIAMEEFKPRRRVARWMHAFIQINIGNLAGVPSIVYGIIGLTVFARMFGVFGAMNPTMYDRMAVIRTTSGEMVQGSVMSEDESAVELVVPDRGARRIETAAIVARRDVYVREHRFVLKDGTAVTGLFRDVTPETVTVNVTGEGAGAPEAEAGEESRQFAREVKFAPTDVAEYHTTNFIQWGDSGTFFYFQLPFGSSILSGGLTLGLVILPIIIIASREALRAVPSSLREGAMALGCTPWQTIRRIVLPSSVPGIMTGAILAMSRAIGEAAPLLMAGAFLFILQTPRNLLDSFAALPLQIFNWAGKPQEEFHKLAASGIIVLLAVLLVFNLMAIIIRQAFSKNRN